MRHIINYLLNTIHKMQKHPIYNLQVFYDGKIIGPKGYELKYRLDKDGYYRFNHVFEGKHLTLLVHRIVAESYIGLRPYNMTVNHVDGNKRNNCANNLEYVTKADNISHAFKSGLVSTCTPITINNVSYYSKREAERKTGIPRYLL